MAVHISPSNVSHHARFLLTEMTINGFAQASADGWTIDNADFSNLSDEELRILGYPENADATLLVTQAGIINRPGARFDWRIELDGKFYDASAVEGPILKTAAGEWLLPPDVFIGIEALGSLSEDADVLDQFQLAAHLQSLHNIVLPPEWENKSFVVPQHLQIKPEVNEDATVTLALAVDGVSDELNHALGQQIDRKNRIARSADQMSTSLRVKDESGRETLFAFAPEKKLSLKRLGEFRAAPLPRQAFMRSLRDDPTLGFDPHAIDMSSFSERVLRVGLFIPSPEIVFGFSGNEWIPVIECRDHAGEVKHLLVQNQAELAALNKAMDRGREDGSGLVEFRGHFFTLEDAEELARICANRLADTNKTPPAGRIIPIIDEEESEDGFEEEEEEEDVEESPYALAERTFEAPPGLASGFALYPHQRIGVGWLQSLFHDTNACGGLLADDMGLGKTIQVLSFLHWHRTIQTKRGTNHPYLIVAPVALLKNWEEECERFFPGGLQPYVAHRDAARVIPDEYFCRDVLFVSNYETLTRQILSWATIDWAVVALDEAQQIKNAGTIKSQAARSLKSEFNIAMTGTPVENQLSDLWAIMDFVEPGFLGTSSAFNKLYVNNRSGEAQHSTPSRLREVIGHRMLRRLKEDALQDLPDKHLKPAGWDGSSFHPWALPMTPAQQKAQQDFKHQYELDLQNPEIQSMEAFFRALDGFRRLVDHPLVADKRLVPILETSADDLLAGSAKLQVTMSIVEQARARNEKVIIFSGFRLSQQLLARVLNAKYQTHPPIINGETPISSSRSRLSRQAIIDKFNDSEGFDVLILSPLAAGVGLNITSANHVIHFTRHWNPAKESQATDRAYRIGQKRDVHVYYPMSLSDQVKTFDAVLHNLLLKKMTLAENALTPTTDLKESDFDEMF